MQQLSFRDLDHGGIWEYLVDKRYPHILLHRFNPHYAVEWWHTSLQLPDGRTLPDVQVRQMEMDVLTGLDSLKKVLELNTHYLYVYQFDRPLPGNLVPDQLPAGTSEKILGQNGLHHTISIHFETVTISSFDQQYLLDLSAHPVLKEYMCQPS